MSDLASTKSNSVSRWLQTISTYDFCPEFSAKVRRFLYHPFGVLMLAALAALACGLFLHAQGFILCGGILAVILLGVIWPWLAMRGVVAHLAFDRQRTSESDAVEVRLTLHNRLPWSAWGIAVRDGFGDDQPVAGIASAPRRRTALCRWTFQPLRRGVYPLITPRITTGFPFGLWDNARSVTVDTPLIVWPMTLPVGPVPMVSGNRQVEGNVSRNKVGSNGDVLGVRPYRRGDSPRRIHWAQSARHDRLIVCELQSNARPVIQLVLDADSRSHVTNDSREWAIRIVASLAKGWLQSGAMIGVTWGDVEFEASSGLPHLHRILDALAAIPDQSNKPLADVLACPKCRGFRDGLQVIVTTDIGITNMDHRSDEQRWIVLQSKAFDDNALSPLITVQPWLLIDSIERIPTLLQGGWREAQHGS